MRETLCVHLLFLTASLLLFSLRGVKGAPFPVQEVQELQGPDQELKQAPLYYQAGTQGGQGQSMDPRMRLLLLSWLQNVGALQDRIKAKKSCHFNAGLSHACDYKDALDAIHEGMYLGSDMTPGKK